MSKGRAPIRRTVKVPGHGSGQWFGAPRAQIKFDSPIAPIDTPKAGTCSVLSEKRKGGPRSNCPVQLIFKDGAPFLRLCTAAKTPGKLVRLPYDGVEANKIAQRVCAHWAAGDKKFERWAEHEGLGRLRR